MPFHCPKELVEALRRGDEAAKGEINRLCGAQLRELVAAVKRRYRVRDDEKLLTSHVMSWLEMFLIRQHDHVLASLATPEPWEHTFTAFALQAAYRRFLYGPAVILTRLRSRLLALASGGEIPGDENVVLNVGELQLDTQWFRRPHPDAIVSGDLAERVELNGQLWILVADATGHGWLAHVLIAGVAGLWKALLKQLPAATPKVIVEQLDRHLSLCLPPDFYIESWLFNFTPDRVVSATAAGRCYLMVRRSSDVAVQIEDHGNPHLGIGVLAYDEQTWDLQQGDELLIATDGLYEQPSGHTRLDKLLAPRLKIVGSSRTLHDAVIDEWETAVASKGQFDDVTIVSVRSR